TTGALSSGRPGVSPLVRLFTFLIPKQQVEPRLTVDGETVALAPVPAGGPLEAPPPLPAIEAAPDADEGDTVTVPLVRLAYGRSGDKGDISNVGIIARHPDLLPCIAREVTAEALRAHLAHLV